MLFYALAAAATLNPAPTPDICAAMLPPRLVIQLTFEQKDYVIPKLTDVPAERITEIANQGGWPCPFVAIADVDGDGALDRAVVLKHKDQAVTRLIVARNHDAAWTLELVKDWPIAITAAFVEPLEAGLYEQKSTQQNVAAQLDNLNSIQSDHAGFIGGQLQGPKAAYFYLNNKWQELWLDD